MASPIAAESGALGEHQENRKGHTRQTGLPGWEYSLYLH
jgi:hypothetical protein